MGIGDRVQSLLFTRTVAKGDGGVRSPALRQNHSETHTMDDSSPPGSSWRFSTFSNRQNQRPHQDASLAKREGDGVSPADVRVNLRVQSDSALLSMRRRQQNGRHGILASADDSVKVPINTRVKHYQRVSHRLSLGPTTLRPQFNLDAKQKEGFFDVFGLLGVPMLVFFLSTSLAVLSQAYLQVYPVKFANYLMNTTTYDSGEFWMLPDPEPAPTIVATVLLVCLAACYVYLGAFMIFFRHKAFPKARDVISPTSKTETRTGSRTGSIPKMFAFPELNSSQLLRLVLPALLKPSAGAATKAMVAIPASVIAQAETPAKCNIVPAKNDPTLKKPRRLSATTQIPIAEIYKQFVSPDGVYHAYYNVLYDIPKLVFQSITLLAYLRKGFPIALTAFYASLLAFNYLISFYRFQRKRIDRHLVITRMFYLFDLFFAAFAPILVLAFAYYRFDFDRDAYRAKVETLPPGVFDANARLFANPHEMSIFRLAFGSLRLTTGSTIFAKCSLLLLSLVKWRKIIVYLIQLNHSNQRRLVSHASKSLKHSSSRRHLLFGIVLFVFFGVGIIVYTAGSISTSLSHCKVHKEHCVVVSYQWTFPDESCPCLVYINTNRAPRSYDEWINPPDATEELGEMAKMGQLKVIQIINREVPTLPETLRHCHKLEQLILMYAKTEVIPSWTKELTYMQYLHIEGDFHRNLKEFPLDTFSHMKELMYLHTGIIPQITTYPSLDALGKLKTLVIAAPHQMRELPNLEHLKNLRALLLVEQARVSKLPSLKPLKKLRQLELFYRSEMCCNGFITPGVCDLNDYQCKTRDGEPVTQCSTVSMASEDVAMLKRIRANVCSNWTFDLQDEEPTRLSTDTACGGVMYRQCQLGDKTGMCFNGRMQVISCDTTGIFEKMRRLQIRRGVGPTCTPQVEAWLGCQ